MNQGLALAEGLWATLNTRSDRDSAGRSGGGTDSSTLHNCTLTNNSAQYGGGASGSTLDNCLLADNAGKGRVASGGGAAFSTLKNCTLVGNSSTRYDGGASGCTLNNCIVYFNTVQGIPNNYDSSSILNYSCTSPLPSNGTANITNAPLFVDQASGDLRLQSNSPCINAGQNVFAPAGPDLDGNPRIVGGTVDIGAYEFQSLSLIGSGVVSNQFGFNGTGQSNWVIVLEASADFTNWIPLTTNTLGGSPFPFRDPAPPNLPKRFYRARKL